MEHSEDQQERSEVGLGLCCLFLEHPVRFRATTAKAQGMRQPGEASERLAEICTHNAQSLQEAIRFCSNNGIRCFRINSQILPLKTHPEHGYQLEELPGGEGIREMFLEAGALADREGVRLSFHPDQFVVLSSPRSDVVERSVAELEYQGEVAEWVGADVINIHGGGGYGDKPSALGRFEKSVEGLSDRVRQRLTVENDDRTYTPADLAPLCKSAGIPLVYDVHHHRCNPDELDVETATEMALATWDRTPLFHISSPRDGWEGTRPGRHHDFIDIEDFPDSWRGRCLTVEVEAKAKEVAVLKLMRQLEERWFVYVVRCDDDSLYTGIAKNDVARRIAEHNRGTASKYTRSRLPVSLVYQESQWTRGRALRREVEIKALSRASKEHLIRDVAPDGR